MNTNTYKTTLKSKYRGNKKTEYRVNKKLKTDHNRYAEKYRPTDYARKYRPTSTPQNTDRDHT